MHSLHLLQWLELLHLQLILLFEQLDQVHVGLLAISCCALEVIPKSTLIIDFVGYPQRILHQLWHLRLHLVHPTCQLVLILELLRHGGNELLLINVVVLLAHLVVDVLFDVDGTADIGA